MIEWGGRLAQRLGLPRSLGQIFGLLYLSPEPLTLDDMVEQLAISKASASTGTRQLLLWGAIRTVWVPGQRRDYYAVAADLRDLLRGVFRDFFKPRLARSGEQLALMRSSLDAEIRQGLLSAEEHRVCAERLEALQRMQKKMSNLTPLAEKLI